MPQQGNTGHSLKSFPSNQEGRAGSSFPTNSICTLRMQTKSVGALPQLFTDNAIWLTLVALTSSITIVPAALSSLKVTEIGVSTLFIIQCFIYMPSNRPGALPHPPG